jgi:adenine-specific DNA-methyltransferase
VDKLKMHSPDLTQQSVDKIADLFPTVVTERLGDDGNPVQAIDFDLLRQELADQVVEGPQERYQLDWPGKRAALFAANAPIAKTLRPVREESVDFDSTKNLFIEGDNLDILKLLQESYLGKVKLIYIDPPYNTGTDLIYDDDFAESADAYLSRSGQTSEGASLVANTEANGRFHSDWLSMMYPRLKLARNLLSEDGILAVSIDDNEAPRLRQLCDEIFGAKAFLGTLVWRRRPTSDSRNLSRVSTDHEYVHLFGRRRRLGFAAETSTRPSTRTPTGIRVGPGQVKT